jgi:phospholipid/cholesterol/gamma-HCH transport system ATP-binding protein
MPASDLKTSRESANQTIPAIEVRDLEMNYGSYVVMRDINFTVADGQVLVVMGGSGCGKSTLLRYLIGLKEVSRGDVLYHGKSFVKAGQEEREQFQRRFGVLYQAGALWSSRTLAENVALPLEEYTELSAKEVRELASLKLSLVGLNGFEDFYPSEISGGMRKRAGLARAMALDPEILFFDEPSAGLDPISSRRLDDLILQLRDSLGTTVVVVTHELPSIFAIADTAIFLDADTKHMLVQGDPKALVKDGDPKVRTFLLRGREVAQNSSTPRNGGLTQRHKDTKNG